MDLDKESLKSARRQELSIKLRTGWNVLVNKYGYANYNLAFILLFYFATLGPIFLIYVLPWYIFVIMLEIELVAMLLPILLICGIISGIFFGLLMLNYLWIRGW